MAVDDPAVRVTIAGIRELDQRLARIPPAIRQAFRNELVTVFEEMKTWMIENTLTGGTTAYRLQMRSGNFIASLRVRVVDLPGGSVNATLTQDQRYRSALYGPVHEFGATIRPRRAQALAIPLSAEAESYQSPRDFPERLFFVEAFKGKRVGFLMVRSGPGQAVAMWALMSEVKIPARRPFGQTADVWLPMAGERTISAVRAVIENPEP